MEYLIAMDLEGIHGVVGRPYSGLSKGSDAHIQACENALKEVNTAIRALFDQGADKVVFWDNHGGGGNLDPAQIDSRAIQVCPKGEPYRFDFVNGYHFDGILLMGYHSREGTLGGVLAHTYNSSKIQYVKLDGKPMGEIEIDSYICAAHNICKIVNEQIIPAEMCPAKLHIVGFCTIFVVVINLYYPGIKIKLQSCIIADKPCTSFAGTSPYDEIL